MSVFGFPPIFPKHKAGGTKERVLEREREIKIEKSRVAGKCSAKAPNSGE